jgi:ABC-2 type transport system permease protein
MTTTEFSRTVDLDPDRNVPGTPQPGFGHTLRSEWIKFWTVRSTLWTTAMLVVLGAGLTVLVCALSAEWLASDDADAPALAFVTWGRMVAQITAIVLGTLVVTSEYGTGMIRATLAATPRRGAVLAAKAIVLSGTLFVVGTITAFAGYLGGNVFLEREGIGVALGDEGVLRAMFGSGVYMAGLGLLAAAVGVLLRHTAAALAVVLALVFVVGNMAFALPGTWGEWTAKLMPGNAGSVVATPVSFEPGLLDPWVGLAVFAGEVAVLSLVAWATFRRRDA